MWGQLRDWIQDHQALIWWLSGVSLAILVGSLVLVPVILARIPADYFAHPKRESAFVRRHPALRIAYRIAKNMLGALLVLAGVAMLVLPGQGLLTLLIGVLLVDFPGKYRFEKWLVSRPRVLRAINWIRKQRKQPPLQLNGASAA